MRFSSGKPVRSAAAAAVVTLCAAGPPALAAPADPAIRGGRYVVSTRQGSNVGEWYMARSKPVMRAGSTIALEISGCLEDGDLEVEIDLAHTYIHPDGRFRVRQVDRFYGGDVAGIWHVDGLFSSSFSAQGTVWGFADPRACRVTSKHPLHFKAHYDGQGYYAR